MKKIIQLPTGHIKVLTVNNEPELTQQHFKDECDINNIIKKYTRTGSITHLNAKKGVYMDLTTLPDYQQSLNTVLKANEAFESLPSKIRKKFHNDPQQLIDFLSDDKNYEEAMSLGLMDEAKTQNYYQSIKNKKSENPNSNPQNTQNTQS